MHNGLIESSSDPLETQLGSCVGIQSRSSFFSGVARLLDGDPNRGSLRDKFVD